MRAARILSGVLSILLLPGLSARSQQLDVKRHKLGNGLTILTQEDHSVPVICYITFFRVGSRNERPGMTGMSHLFEHMMFNGSAKFAPKEFDRLLESNGGYSNGSTTEDWTNYWEEFPKEALELVLDLESDRMRALRLTTENLEQERSIVKEERRVGVDNSVMGKMYEELSMAAYSAHSYRWPVIGWMADLNNITLEDAKDYFRTYYAPNNATVVIVGDFDTQQVIALMEKYFGNIPAQAPPRSVNNPEEEQRGERRVKLHKVAELPAVMMAYHGVSVKHEDAAALKVLEIVLSAGQSSRLYRELVYEKQVASQAGASFSDRIDPALFTFLARLKPGHRTDEAEALIHGILEKIKTEPVSDQELQKAKNIFSASFIRRLKTNQGRAWAIGFHETVYGDYSQMVKALDRINAVTKEDIKRVAEKYFGERNRTVLTLVPEKAAR